MLACCLGAAQIERLIALPHGLRHLDIDSTVASLPRSSPPAAVFSASSFFQVGRKLRYGRDLLIESVFQDSNILCEEESGDLLGRLVHTRDSILEPCSWYHVELLLPGANDQDLHHIQRVLGPEYVLTLTSEDLSTSETSEEDLEAFRETISHVLVSGDGQDLNSLIRSPKAKGRPQST